VAHAAAAAGCAQETSAGTAAVHFAAAAGQATTCSLLAALGADVDKETAGGFTALHIAASGNQSACIHALARMRAKVDYQDSRHYAGPLHWAARGGHIDAVKALLEEGATLELRDRAGNTPLMWAAKHGNTRVVRPPPHPCPRRTAPHHTAPRRTAPQRSAAVVWRGP